MHDGYTQTYFAKISEASHASAKVIVPIAMKLLRPRSVVDVGCGVGAWVAQFKQQGVANVIGIDGPYVSCEDLVISADEFISADLTQPLKLGQQFDLAISLEVAEHLPEISAEQFIATLTQLAPVVLFSAAIPHQGGEDHINEQWPAYWATLFAKHGYKAVDAIRSRVWDHPDVEWWYAQNMLIFASGSALNRLEESGHSAMEPSKVLPLVHPGNFLHQEWRIRVLHLVIDLVNVIPVDTHLILADDNLCGSFYLPDRHVRPFTEINGTYGGPPADEASAIKELKRQITSGVQYIAFAWPAFWQLEQYPGLTKLLRSQHHEVCENDRIVIFELQD